MSIKNHDSLFKGLFSVRENLQDLIRGTLPREILGKVHLETLEYDTTEYVDQELGAHFKDISCNVRYGDGQIKVSLLYEHKSHPERNVHLQLLQYILNVWENQSDNRQELTPVICVVFYHGKQRWIHAELLKNVSRELRRYVPMFDYVLLDTKDIEDHAIIQHFKAPGVRILVLLLKHYANLIGFILENPELVREIFKEFELIEETTIHRFVLYLFHVSGENPDVFDKIMKTVSPESSDILEVYRAKFIEEGIRQGIEQGIEKGIEQGLMKIAWNMISKGYPDDQIAEITGLGIENIQSLRDSPKPVS